MHVSLGGLNLCLQVVLLSVPLHEIRLSLLDLGHAGVDPPGTDCIFETICPFFELLDAEGLVGLEGLGSVVVPVKHKLLEFWISHVELSLEFNSGVLNGLFNLLLGQTSGCCLSLQVFDFSLDLREGDARSLDLIAVDLGVLWSNVGFKHLNELGGAHLRDSLQGLRLASVPREDERLELEVIHTGFSLELGVFGGEGILELLLGDSLGCELLFKLSETLFKLLE